MLQPHISVDGYHRALHCGDWLEMLETDDHAGKRLRQAYFCKYRLCPGCAWRKSMGDAVVITAIMGAMVADRRVPLMVTLTAPNCEGNELGESILRYNRAWDKLIRRRRYRAAWADNIRKLEVTYNAEADTYHPHLHVLVFVSPGYFGGTKGGYISRAQLLADWREVYGDPRITQVDLRKSYGTDAQGIAELAKYTAKSGDYTHSQAVFNVFYEGLKGKRLSGYSGRCKALRAAYKAGQLREHVNRDLTKYTWRVLYTDYQRTGNYVQEWSKPYDAILEDSDDLEIASAWAYMED